MTTVSRAKPDVGQYFLVYDKSDHELYKQEVLKNPMHYALWCMEDGGNYVSHVHWSGTRDSADKVNGGPVNPVFDTYPLTDVQAAALIMRSVHNITRARWHEICHELTGVEP